MPFSNQFQIGNPDNEPGKLEVHFDNLLVESLQRESSQQVKKQKKAERRRLVKKEDEHQRIIYRMKAMVHLTRKQEKIHKKVMKLLKEMIELHNHVFELQLLTKELSTLRIQPPVIHV